MAEMGMASRTPFLAGSFLMSQQGGAAAPTPRMPPRDIRRQGRHRHWLDAGTAGHDHANGRLARYVDLSLLRQTPTAQVVVMVRSAPAVCRPKP